MIPGDQDDGPAPARGWTTERVTPALNDEHRNFDRVKLREAALGRVVGPARGMHGKGQTHHGMRSHISCRTAGHARPRGTTAHDHRSRRQLTIPELTYDRCPGGIQLSSRCLVAPSGHAVGLFDQRGRQADRRRGPHDGSQIRRVDPAARAVPQKQRSDGIGDGMDMGAGQPVGSLKLHDPASITIGAGGAPPGARR